MTPTEISAHAIELGITPEKFPEFFVHDKTSVWTPGPTRTIHYQYRCTLPDPDGDDSRCSLWDGFYMRALDRAGLDPQVIFGEHETCVIIGVNAQERHFFKPTPTAALRAAWLAKGAKA